MSEHQERPSSNNRAQIDPDREILNLEEAARFLGVSVKTFNKVLHAQSLPARKIGREWKFSRRALVEWVGCGRSDDYYRESSSSRAATAENGRTEEKLAKESSPKGLNGVELQPQPPPQPNGPLATAGKSARRTSGWRIELD